MKKTYIKRKANRICTACGKQDERTLSGKILCSECEKIRKRETTKPVKSQKNSKSMAEIIENVRMADSLGMSYGNFMANKV